MDESVDLEQIFSATPPANATIILLLDVRQRLNHRLGSFVFMRLILETSFCVSQQ